MYRSFFKRFQDLLLVIIALAVLLPVMVLIVILLWCTGHRSVFFVQPRVGKNERVFSVLKFKTMTDARDAAGQLLPDAERLTRFGQWLRRSSLDELPQLFNVLKGDMSLVGPRPLLIDYLPLYNTRQRKRHWVRPGITGWAQVNGRNAISWEQKFVYDVWYVDNLRFSLDWQILLKTVQKVFVSEGISQQGHVTIEPFKGTLDPRDSFPTDNLTD